MIQNTKKQIITRKINKWQKWQKINNNKKYFYKTITNGNARNFHT